MRKEFSAATQKSTEAAQGGPPPEKSGGSKAVVLGGVALCGAAGLAYYLDPGRKRKAPEPPEVEANVNVSEDVHVEEAVPRVEEESSTLRFAPEVSEEKSEVHSGEDVAKVEGLGGSGGESEAKVDDQGAVSEGGAEKDLGELSQNASVGVSLEENVGDKSGEEKAVEVNKEEVEAAPAVLVSDQQENLVEALATQKEITEDKAQVVLIWVPNSYYL